MATLSAQSISALVIRPYARRPEFFGSPLSTRTKARARTAISQVRRLRSSAAGPDFAALNPRLQLHPSRRVQALPPERSFSRQLSCGEKINTISRRWEHAASSADNGETAVDQTEAIGFQKWVIAAEKGFNKLATDFVVNILDTLYADRLYARFYVLETIARVPYFAFVSVLHLYESFGWWRRADYLKIHFAESWNELHHLLVMEALGGDERWFDRFLAQHIAVGYYFMTALMYLFSPRMAYNFSEFVEEHAFMTYDKFIKSHGDELRKLPAPDVAVQYYTKGDLYMFDEFQTGALPFTRRPKIDTLYDVFYNIREDEAQHCKTMRACQTGLNLRSPHEDVPLTELALKESDFGPADCQGILECAVTATSFAERARKSGGKYLLNTENGVAAAAEVAAAVVNNQRKQLELDTENGVAAVIDKQ